LYMDCLCFAATPQPAWRRRADASDRKPARPHGSRDPRPSRRSSAPSLAPVANGGTETRAGILPCRPPGDIDTARCIETAKFSPGSISDCGVPADTIALISAHRRARPHAGVRWSTRAGCLESPVSSTCARRALRYNAASARVLRCGDRTRTGTTAVTPPVIRVRPERSSVGPRSRAALSRAALVARSAVT
jgi:hypothetical protein